jgi:hypothetical protein
MTNGPPAAAEGPCQTKQGTECLLPSVVRTNLGAPQSPVPAPLSEPAVEEEKKKKSAELNAQPGQFEQNPETALLEQE